MVRRFTHCLRATVHLKRTIDATGPRSARKSRGLFTTFCSGVSFLRYVSARVDTANCSPTLVAGIRIMKSSLITLLKSLWNDDRGFIVSAELVLVGTIAVLSMVVGLTAVSRSITQELYDVAESYDSVNQYDNGRQGQRRYNTGNDAADIIRR